MWKEKDLLKLNKKLPEGNLTLEVVPMAAPRLSQRDKWNPRPIAKRYYKYKDDLAREANKKGFYLSGGVLPRLIFYLPIPKSWSKKKKTEMEGHPHRLKKKNDLDNLIKGFKDALIPEDGDVWRYEPPEKRWSCNPRIEVIYYS